MRDTNIVSIVTHTSLWSQGLRVLTVVCLSLGCFLWGESEAQAATKKYEHRLVVPPEVITEGIDSIAFAVGGAGARFIEPALKTLMRDDDFPLRGKHLDVPSFHPPVSTTPFNVVTPDSAWTSILHGGTAWSRGERREQKQSDPDKEGNVTTYYYSYGTYQVEAKTEWKDVQGNVLHSANLLESGEVYDVSTDGYPPIPDVTPFVKKEFEKFARGLVLDIRPRWALENALFRMDSSVGKLMRSFYKKRGGISLSELYSELQAMFQDDSYNATIANNIGTCLLLAGALEEALEFYEKSVDYESGCKVCSDNIGLAKSRIDAADELAVMGLIVRGAAPQTSGGDRAMSGSASKIAGSKKTRVSMFAAPDFSSDTVAQLPGGLPVTILKAEGDFVLVRAPDGKEGYVMAKDVR